jgi:hypothetical protein
MTGVNSRQSRLVALFFLGAIVVAGCGGGPPTACDGLVYKEEGLTRKEYLPCAGEMIATLDRLAPQVETMVSGDESARSEARASVRDLRRLIDKAGGRNLIERWDDRTLTSLNINIFNAFNHHEACMMVAGQIFGRAPLGDEKYREAAKSECRAYRRSYEDAKNTYRRLL